MITRKQTNSDESTFKQVEFELTVDGDWQKRHFMAAHVYPNYDEWVRVTIPGLGFTLSIDDTRNLHKLLTEVLKDCK